MYKDLLFWDFLPENWEILHIFSIGKGAHNGPQNQPRKIPGHVSLSNNCTFPMLHDRKMNYEQIKSNACIVDQNLIT